MSSRRFLIGVLDRTLPGREQEAREDMARSRRLCRVAVGLLTVALVLLATHILWSLIVDRSPAPVLPPAREAIQGTVPFRFAVVGDNRGNMEVFEEILARIKEEHVSLILHTGDLVDHSGERQFTWLLHELGEEKLPVPLCAVPGNHDIDEAAKDPSTRCRLYGRAFGQRRYWFAYANALFVALDDSTERVSPDDLQWLDRTLAQFRSQYTLCFVYMHVPPRDPRPGRTHALEEGAENLIGIMTKHRVNAVFAGHIHSYLEDNVAGIPVYITGGAGAELEEPSDRYHYLVCTVAPDGSFSLQKRDVDYLRNTDYPEYAFRVKFPSNIALFVSASLLFSSGLLFGLGSFPTRSRKTDLT